MKTRAETFNELKLLNLLFTFAAELELQQFLLCWNKWIRYTTSDFVKE